MNISTPYHHLHIHALALLALATLIMAGCASKQDVSSLQGQVSYQQRQQAKENQELKKKISQLETDLAKAHEDLTQEITKTSTPVRSKQADLWMEIENLRAQQALANGHIDALTQKIKLLEIHQNNATTTLTQLSTDVPRIDTVVTTMAGQLGIDLPDTASAPEQVAAGGNTSPSAAEQNITPAYDSSQALYKKALQSFYAKQYAQALSLWQEFVTTFTKDALVPNALFWQGECHYQMHDYARAVLAYQKVIEKYTKSNKYRPALLKQGMSFFKLKKKKPGNLVLQDLIKKYPKTIEARRAKAFLKSN